MWHAFPGQRQMKPELDEIGRLKKGHAQAQDGARHSEISRRLFHQGIDVNFVIRDE
jgi:hypothetical protein